MLEGIMMKNKSQYSVAVRRPDGEIEVKTDEYVGIAGDKAWAKLPLIRGMVNFIDSMILGMKTLSWSASFYEDEEEEAKPGKFEKFLLKLFGEKAEKVVMGATVAFSVIMAASRLPVRTFSEIYRIQYTAGHCGRLYPHGNLHSLCGTDLFHEGYPQNVYVSWCRAQVYQLH